ncbi:hypothetical protein Aduo_018532 [Ancylostoma duodenale]
MNYNGYNWPYESYDVNGQPIQEMYEGQEHSNDSAMQGDLYYQQASEVLRQPVPEWVIAYLTSPKASPEPD